MPKGWFGGSANAGGYESGIDRAVFHGGKAAAFVRMTAEGPGEFGTLTQSISAGPYRGKRIRLSAFIKTRDAAAGAGLWMRIDGAGAMLAFDNMEARRIKGTNDWTRAEIVLDVTDKARAIVFGLLFIGRGKAWVDDFRVEVVGADVKSTNTLEKELPAGSRAPARSSR